MKKNKAIIIVIVIAIAVITGLLFALVQLTNNTTNNTTNPSILNNTTFNNSTLSNQTQNQNTPPPDISSDKAKELAQKYVGPGTTLGKPVLTTYKKVKAWQVPVYTLDHKFINNVYIDAMTGEKVD